MSRPRLFAVIALLATSLALAATASAADRSGPVPSNFVKHEGQYWTWYGPADWGASYGAYGITITSPGGNDVVDYGGSSIFCDGTPEQHFKTARRQLKSQIALDKVRFRNVSSVKQKSGAAVQTFDWSAQTRNGKGILGEFELQYAPVDAQYCYGSTLAKYGPEKGFSKTIKILRAVWNNTFYYGTGT